MKYRCYFLFIVFNLSFSISFAGSWKTVDSLLIYWSGTTYNMGIHYQSMICPDINTCLAAGNAGFTDPVIRLTEDGAKTWRTALLDTVTKLKDGNGIVLRDISFPNKKLCIAICKEGYYWISRDSCKTWKLGKLDTTTNLFSVDFYDENYGAIAGAFDYLYLTKNGGDTWKKIQVKLPDDIQPWVLFSVKIVKPGKFIVIGVHPDLGYYIISSTDEGKTWEVNLINGRELHLLYFYNESIGYAYGGQQKEPYSPYYKDIIYKTTNGGKTWQLKLDSLTEKHPYGIYSLKFFDENHGMAVGEGWKMWTTSDGGETWQIVPYPGMDILPDFFADFEFLGSYKKYIACASDIKCIYIYTDNSNSVNNKYDNNLTFNLYPNPLPSGSQLNIKIEADKPGRVEFTVYDALGGRVDEPYARYFDAGIFTVRYTPGQAPAPGSYWLRAVFSDGSTVVKPFVVE